MKKEIISGLLAFGLVLSPAVSLAHEGEDNAEHHEDQSTVVTPDHRLGKPFKDIREEYREKIKDFKASTTEERKEVKEDLKRATSTSERKMIRRGWIKNHLELIINRLEAAIKRSEKFIERLTANLKAKEDAGQDVSVAESKLDLAKNKIKDAETAIKKIMPVVDNALASTTISKDTASVIKQVVSEAVTAVKQAHQAIIDVLRALNNN